MVEKAEKKASSPVTFSVDTRQLDKAADRQIALAEKQKAADQNLAVQARTIRKLVVLSRLFRLLLSCTLALAHCIVPLWCCKTLLCNTFTI